MEEEEEEEEEEEALHAVPELKKTLEATSDIVTLEQCAAASSHSLVRSYTGNIRFVSGGLLSDIGRHGIMIEAFER